MGGSEMMISSNWWVILPVSLRMRMRHRFIFHAVIFQQIWIWPWYYTEHYVGGKSQSWLIPWLSLHGRLSLKWGGLWYDPWAFKWGHHLKIHRPQWTCNMLAMFIKAADLYFNYGAAIPRMSHGKKKTQPCLPCHSAWCPIGSNVLFVIWSIMR